MPNKKLNRDKKQLAFAPTSLFYPTILLPVNWALGAKTMKYIFLFLAFLSVPALAEEATEWQWVSGSSAWDGWFETKGFAHVDIVDGKISAILYDHESKKFKRIKFDGSIEDGAAEIVVTVLATDSDDFPMKGTYAIRDFNGYHIEALVFTTKWKYLALSRRSAKTAPNKSKHAEL